jgi:hypothetical protein
MRRHECQLDAIRLCHRTGNDLLLRHFFARVRRQRATMQLASAAGIAEEEPLVQQWNRQALEAAIEAPFYRWRRWRGVGNTLFLFGVFLLSACAIHPGLRTMWLRNLPLGTVAGLALSGLGVAN